MGEKVRRLAQLGEKRRGGTLHRVDPGHRLVVFQGITSPLVRRVAPETKIRSEPKGWKGGGMRSGDARDPNCAGPQSTSRTHQHSRADCDRHE